FSDRSSPHNEYGSGACRKKRNREDRPALISNQYHQARIVIAAAFPKLPHKIAGVIKRGLVSAEYLYSVRRLTHLFSGANYEDVFTHRSNKAGPQRLWLARARISPIVTVELGAPSLVFFREVQ